jgi:hypothetical protein
MSFRGLQKIRTFTQINHGKIERVFPLLCPVREADWLDGWDFSMIYSKSGLIEKNCVFSTPHHGEQKTIWHVTQYDRDRYFIEFLRVTPNENVVRINIQLVSLDEETTSTTITYQFTALSQEQNEFIETELDTIFLSSMNWWERAINHYLATGEKLLKRSKQEQ